MTAKHLLIGFDGADLHVVEELGAEALPNLFALMERGAFSPLESVKPPATLPNWLTFLTGVDPGEHGVFDFTVREGYGVRFRAGTVREAPLLAERLDTMGQRTAWLSFPGTWPPPALEHGVFISGWDAPVAFEADASFVWPRRLHAEIVARFGGIAFDDVDEFAADQPGWHEALASKLSDRVERKTKLATWLLEREAWDTFAVYFGESDTASHHLWPFHDRRSPRRPANYAPRPGAPTPLGTVYRALDRSLGELLAYAGDGVEVTIVSDHGSGGSSAKVLYLNRVLEEAGFLSFHERSPVELAARTAKTVALRALPPRLREKVFRLGGAVLPSWLESRARFGAIDMDRTRAFSDELNYFPAIHFNVRGREPRGTVPPAEVPALTRELSAMLLALRDPWTGTPVVQSVMTRDELFRGPFTERAPDLFLELALDDGYSLNLMPTASAPPGTGPWRKLDAEEFLGKKGRSLPGAHRSHGLFVAAGPRVRAMGQGPAHIADAAATALARMDVAPPANARGRVLWEILNDTGAATLPIGEARARPITEGDEAEVERRLRALGYID